MQKIINPLFSENFEKIEEYKNKQLFQIYLNSKSPFEKSFENFLSPFSQEELYKQAFYSQKI